MTRFIVFTLLSCLAFTYVKLNAQMPAYQAEVLILGTHNLPKQVLKNKHNRALSTFLEDLARYQATHIVIETPHAEAWEYDLQSKYLTYLDGEYKIGQQAGEQIGFRLAEKLSHSRIYAAESNLPFEGLGAIEVPNEKDEGSYVDALYDMDHSFAADKPGMEEHHAHASYYLSLNDPQYAQNTHQAYARQYQTELEGDLQDEWYRYQQSLFSHIRRLAIPRARILLITNARHIGNLQEFIQQHPNMNLHSLSQFVKVP